MTAIVFASSMTTNDDGAGVTSQANVKSVNYNNDIKHRAIHEATCIINCETVGGGEETAWKSASASA